VNNTNLRTWARGQQQEAQNGAARAIEDERVVRQMRAEAKRAHATLANGGKGGLDPRLALTVFRRGHWRCANKNCPTPKKNLTLDHISGHPKEIEEDADASKKKDLQEGIELGHIDDPKALHVLCEECHTGKRGVHAREDQIEAGKEPDPMRGAPAQ